MNRAVAPSDVIGLTLKIKSVYNGNFLHEVTTASTRDFSTSGDSIYATFYLTSDKMRVGQFYKLQIAYITASGTGQYSSAGTAKFTTKPSVTINNLKPKVSNAFQNSYIGCYEQEDVTEKVYDYCFNVYGPDKTLYWTSGTQLHNSTNDSSPNYSEDYYVLNKEIIFEQPHYIQYEINTINGLSLKSPLYKVLRRGSMPCILNIELNPELNYDNGYIDVYLVDSSNTETLYSGAFSLVRSSDKSGYAEWNTLFSFNLNKEKVPTGLIYRDFLVEQGVNYRYAIHQYDNNGLYSEKIYSNIITADFEDSFLFDGNRQLKLRFNTKISKFSSTHLETKTDTIGSKYPMIFRNGSVNYKEFQLAGLISYHADEEQLFLQMDNLKYDDITTDYTMENFYKERIFKEQALEWLNDGKPKLFRSPTEGMFIVRLIKVSMTPEQKLGRLLHNFSATAYEIAEANYENCKTYDFLNLPTVEEIQVSQFEQIDFKDCDSSWYEWDRTTLRSKNLFADKELVFSFTLSNMRPGDEFVVVYHNGTEERIVIGFTGSYHIESSEGIDELYLCPRFQQIEDLAKYSRINPSDDLTEDEQFVEDFLVSNSGKALSTIKYTQGLYYLLSTEDGTMKPAKEVLGDSAFNLTNLIKLYGDDAGFKIYEMTTSLTGNIIYNYYKTFVPEFQYSTDGEVITNMTYPDAVIEQYIGKTDLYYEMSCKTPKYQLDKIYKIVVRPRPIEYTYEYNETLQEIQLGKMENISLDDKEPRFDTMTIPIGQAHPHSVFYVETKKGYQPYWEIKNNTWTWIPDLNNTLTINDTLMEINKETVIELKDFDISVLTMGAGLVADIYYQYRQYDFACEETDETLLKLQKLIDKAGSPEEKKTYNRQYIARVQKLVLGGAIIDA